MAYITHSLTGIFSKQIGVMYLGAEKRLTMLFKNSYFYKGSDRFFKVFLICFYGSFIGRVGEVDFVKNCEIINYSKVVGYAGEICRKIIMRLINFLRTSMVYSLNIELNCAFNNITIKSTSFILFISTIVNSLLSVILDKDIAILGWFMRGLFIFAGWQGIYSSINWQDLQKTSFVVKYLFRNYKVNDSANKWSDR